MKYFNKTLFFTLIGVFILQGFTLAQPEKSPEEILGSADLARGNSAGLEWTIEIDAIENGKGQNNTLNLKASNFDSLAEFLSPAKVKGRKLLMKDRNMWFIKPGLSKPVPISPRQKLLGGASNGDIASTNYVDDYSITEFFDEADFENQPCFLFNLKAIDKKATYDKIRYWVSKDKLVGVKAEFYTISGKLFKTATFEYENRIEINGEKRPFVSKMIITNAVLKNDVTTMSYSGVVIREIPVSTFNLNLLMK